MPVAEDGGKGVVAVGEDVGLGGHRLAHRAFGRKAPPVDLGHDSLDDHPAAAVGNLVQGLFAGRRCAIDAPPHRCPGHEAIVP